MTKRLTGRTKWLGLILPAVAVMMVSLFSLLNAVIGAAAGSEPGNWLYNLQQPALQLKELGQNRGSFGQQPATAPEIEVSYQDPDPFSNIALDLASPTVTAVTASATPTAIEYSVVPYPTSTGSPPNELTLAGQPAVEPTATIEPVVATQVPPVPQPPPPTAEVISPPVDDPDDDGDDDCDDDNDREDNDDNHDVSDDDRDDDDDRDGAGDEDGNDDEDDEDDQDDDDDEDDDD